MTVALILAGIWLACGIGVLAILAHELLGGRWTRSDQRALERHARNAARAYVDELKARQAVRPDGRVDR